MDDNQAKIYCEPEKKIFTPVIVGLIVAYVVLVAGAAYWQLRPKPPAVAVTSAVAPPAPAPVDKEFLTPAVAPRPPVKPPPPAVKNTPEITIDGEVFIVTKGAQSIKLGLVEIGLIPMEILELYIQQKIKESVETCNRLDPQIKTAEQKYDRLMEECEKANEAFKTSNTETFRNLYAVYQKAYEAISPAKQVYDRLNDEKRFVKTGNFYFESLPAFVRKTKTDADGKFHIVVPGGGSFVLAAHASRQVGDTKEFYFWLLKIDPAADANQTIRLSNDNLTSSGAAESFIFTLE